MEPCAGEREASGRSQSLELETGFTARGSWLLLSLLPLCKAHGRVLRGGGSGSLHFNGDECCVMSDSEEPQVTT